MKDMKKLSYFLLLFVSIFSVSFVACNDDDDKPILANELPQAAKSFISQFYGDVKIAGVTRDSDNGKVEYDVIMANGHDLTFNASGEWTDVDAPNGQTIPDGIAPVKISDYVKAQYSGFGINEIAKEHYGYDVELTNGIDLEFNADGDFLRIDR